MKKIVILGVIVLFVGTYFQPAYANDIQLREHDNSSFEESYEEIIVTIYGIGKTEEIKVLLTEEQANKFDTILKELDFKIKNSGSKSQTIDSIKWAFNSFQEFNLFNKNDENLLEGLLINMILNSNINYDIESIINGYEENFNCLMSGYFESGINRFRDGLGWLMEIILEHLPSWMFFIPLLALIIMMYRLFWGFSFGAYIVVGYKKDDYDPYYPGVRYEKCYCDIHTLGTNGFIAWDGNYYGQIRKVYYESRDQYGDLIYKKWSYVGVDGFIGAKFTNFLEKKAYVLGFAEHVAMGTEIP